MLHGLQKKRAELKVKHSLLEDELKMASEGLIIIEEITQINKQIDVIYSKLHPSSNGIFFFIFLLISVLANQITVTLRKLQFQHYFENFPSTFYNTQKESLHTVGFK